MLKTILIGLKDLRIMFRDRTALVLMLAAPFLLTVGLGLVTGRFSGNSGSALADIPVVIVNLDGQQLGNALVDVLNSQELASLLEPSSAPDVETAQAIIDEDKASAAVIISPVSTISKAFLRNLESTCPGSRCSLSSQMRI